MRSTITGLQMGIRVIWVVQLVLGVLFWTGNALGLVDLHQLLGILLVLGLWTMAALAHRAGVPAGLVAAAAVWGLVVPIVGLTQRDLADDVLVAVSGRPDRAGREPGHPGQGPPGPGRLTGRAPCPRPSTWPSSVAA